MATPFSLFKAAERLVNARAPMLANETELGKVCATQTSRLCEKIGGLRITDDDASEVLEALNNAKSPFTDAQRQTISDTVQQQLDGDSAPAIPDNRNVAKEQRCIEHYNYMPLRLWDMLKSSDTLKNKFKQIAHFNIDVLQLRNADARTKRIIVATCHVASKMFDRDPSDAYADVQLFTDAQKSVRDGSKGPQSLKVFPLDPDDFVKRFPGSYPDDDLPVEPQVDIKLIKERANKDWVPLRGTNAKITTSQSLSRPGSSQLSVVGHQQRAQAQPSVDGLDGPLMRQLLSMFIQGGAGSASSASDIPGIHIFNSPKRAETSDDIDAADSDRPELAPLIKRGYAPGHGAPGYTTSRYPLCTEGMCLYILDTYICTHTYLFT
jgi:hypothetical protein